LPLCRPDLRPRQRLLPDVEEVAEREGPVHRRLDVDDPVGRVRVEPGEAGAAAHERRPKPWLELWICDPDSVRDALRRAVHEDREARVDVEGELLGGSALDAVDALAGRRGRGGREIRAGLERRALRAGRAEWRGRLDVLEGGDRDRLRP